MTNFTFKRPSLAVAYCDSLEGNGISNARSGLFLAAPRRVGKSTFLLEELIPEAQSRHWVTIYVDLWANKNADPAELIAEAIKVKIAEYQSKIIKMAKSVKLNKIHLLGTLILDFNEPGLPAKVTLPDALRLLVEMTEKPIMLVIDEAQNALATDTGLNTMFAIKSARDQININSKKTAFMLVCTGSNQDKLAQLVLRKSQPFFGSDITAFPLLHKEYTDAFTDWVNHNLARANHFTKDSMWDAFQLLGHRPEILRQVVGRIAISGLASNFDVMLKQDAMILNNQIWEEFENDFNSLNLLQKTILKSLMQHGRTWSPFSEESMRYYEQMTKQQNITTTAVQTAIEYLRDKDFIWQSGRGSYALEDSSFAEWYAHYLNVS